MANDGTVKIGISLDESELESGLKKSGENMRKSVQQISQETGKSVDEIKAEVKKLAEEFQKSGDNIPLSYKKAYAQMGIDAKSMRQDVEKEAKKLPDGFEESAKKASDDVKKETEKIPDYFKDSGEKSSKNFGEGLSKLGSVASGAIKVGISALAGVATAATGAVGGLLALESATEEYRIAQGKLNTAFEAAGYGPETASEAYTRFYEILGDTDTATEASQLLAKLAQSEEDVSKWADIAAGVSGTFGDSLPIEGLIEASNETAKVGQVTGVLADALNWAGISEDEFNEKLAACTDESERNQLIMDTLSGTYDEASDAFYRNNEALVESRKAQVQVDEALSKLGKSVSDVKTRLLSDFLPAISDAVEGLSGILTGTEGAKEQFSAAIKAIINKATELLPDFLDLGAEIVSSLAQGIIDNVPEILDKIPEVIGDIAESIGDALGFDIEESIRGIVAAFQELLPVITGVTAAVVAYKTAMMIASIIQGVTTAITAFKTANEAATIAQAALNAIMNANPFVLIATLIAGVVTALITLWNTNDEFREAVTSAWEAVKNAAETVCDAVVNFFTSAWEKIKNAWSVVTDFFKTVWDGIKAVFSVVKDVLLGYFQSAWESIKSVWDVVIGYFENIWDTIEGIFSVVENVLRGDFEGAWEAIKGVLSGWGDYFSSLYDMLVNAFSNVWDAFSSIGSNIVDGIKSGISSAWGALTGFVSDKFNSLVGGVKNFLGIASPSKVFAKIGGYMAEGVGVGWDDEFSDIQKDINKSLDFSAAIQKSIPIVRSVASSMVPRGVFGGQNVTNNTNSSTVFYINVSGASNREEARNIGREIGAEAQREMRRRGLVMA